MFRSRLIRASGLALLVLSGGAQAQQGAAPLSAIDWLERAPRAAAHPVRPDLSTEPGTARSGHAPKISVAPLETPAQQRRGLLPKTRSGLSPDIWKGADPKALIALATSVGFPRLPAAQELLLTLLSAEADDMESPRAAEAWLLGRIDHLATLAAVDAALALTLQSGPRQSPALFDRWLRLSLLSDSEASACAALNDRPALSTAAAARIYCLARLGDVDTAALLFGTTAAIGGLDPRTEALLARFLDPDLEHNTALPRPPLRPDPLTFRLYEAAGAPLSISSLPRSFTPAGLRPQMGWKTQLDAAERLVRAGVLSADRLMALYADRKPAASGGIWDRVGAVQALQRALERDDPSTIAKHLPPLWRSLRAGGLEVPMSAQFAPALAQVDLPPHAARIAYHMQLLSPRTAPRVRTDLPNTAFITSVAQSRPDPQAAQTPLEQAIAKGFAQPQPKTPQQSGARLLEIVDLLEDGAEGDMAALTSALSTLRAQGLGDLATRAALQILILRAPI